MKTNEEEEDRRFGEAVRAALPPLPDGFDPARASESFFAALAARNAAAGIRPPDVSDRLAFLARKTADSRRPPAAVRRPLRCIAAAAAVAAVAGAAAVAVLASTHCGDPRALPSLTPEKEEQTETPLRLGAPVPDEPANGSAAVATNLAASVSCGIQGAHTATAAVDAAAARRPAAR